MHTCQDMRYSCIHRNQQTSFKLPSMKECFGLFCGKYAAVLKLWTFRILLLEFNTSHLCGTLTIYGPLYQKRLNVLVRSLTTLMNSSRWLSFWLMAITARVTLIHAAGISFWWISKVVFCLSLSIIESKVFSTPRDSNEGTNWKYSNERIIRDNIS